MDEKREMLRHLLATLAYRTQKALREAPSGFGEFRAAPDVRTPRELVRHMTSVLGYARTFFVGGEYRPEPLATLDAEVGRFHAMLEELGGRFRTEEFSRTTPERFLQGPLSDAMTHAGQLALMRRLFGSPVPPENFIVADIRSDNATAGQPDPVSPDREWNTPAGPEAFSRDSDRR